MASLSTWAYRTALKSKMAPSLSLSLGASKAWGPMINELVEKELGGSGSGYLKGSIGWLALSGGLLFSSFREGLICGNVSFFSGRLLFCHCV